MPKKSRLVEEQISKLVVKNEDSPLKNVKSPTIQKLRDVDQKVQKMKLLFENGKQSGLHEIDSQVQKKSTSSPSQILKSLDCLRRSSSKSPKNESNVPKIDRIVGELIDRENEYIQTLENGIENYIQPIMNPKKCQIVPVPSEIRFQKYKLFGNIEDVYWLHKSTVLPQIMACENKAQRIAETFIKFIENNTLYAYIDYAIIHLHAKEMVTSYHDFFKALQFACDDRLGVHSFLIQPIQKLPRYPLLFEEMIKELSKDMLANKSSLASLCVAKKQVERFLIRMNQALKLNDIKETRDLEISIQYGMLNTLQLEFQQDINKPNFLIVPSFKDFNDFRSPLNVFDLGRFIMIESFQCQEHDPYHHYLGDLFLFEKGLIYTQKFGRSDKNGLSYRDYFKFGRYTSIHLEQEQKRFTLGDIKHNRVVTFTAISRRKIIKFYELIKFYHDQRKSFDSAFGADLDVCGVDGRSLSSGSSVKSHECYTIEYAKNYNNNQPAFDNEANVSENMTSHDIANDSDFGWSSDEFSSDISSSYDDIQDHQETPKSH